MQRLKQTYFQLGKPVRFVTHPSPLGLDLVCSRELYQEIPEPDTICVVDLVRIELVSFFDNQNQRECVRTNSVRLQDKDTSGGFATRLDTNPYISRSPRNVLDDRRARSFLSPLTGLVLRPASCLTTLPTR